MGYASLSSTFKLAPTSMVPDMLLQLISRVYQEQTRVLVFRARHPGAIGFNRSEVEPDQFLSAHAIRPFLTKAAVSAGAAFMNTGIPPVSNSSSG